ncbi:DNA mismatch repair endonuclease MutL [Leptolyngbya sp. BL0902]|uniref:DNA mismatch repair endonuclease MutL n=1 Tax=Leptolyngbya sp. BL0902 TaxID=1115757 RepID=UPI0039773498
MPFAEDSAIENWLSPITDAGSRPDPDQICPLPAAMAAQMAAGQVVDSLAAVVRELAENALDAQASRITIQLWPEQGRVQVVDNGRGIAAASLPWAARPHSTSKIRSPQELWQVMSLGFRGQALHSLAQVGTLTLSSRQGLAAQGWAMTYAPNGDPRPPQPIAMAPGTIATVTDLFAQWPSRRQGLPSPSRQMRAVQGIIQDLALCHPQVAWMAHTNDRPWFTIAPGPTAKAILPQRLPRVAEADLRETTRPSLYGVIGLPDRCHRARPDWVKVAVNGRVVSLPDVEQGVIQAFRHTLPRHRFPLCFLHLSLPPQAIDWHRSPDKSALYLHHLEDWVAQGQACVQDLLGQTPTTEGNPRVIHLIKAAEAGGRYGLGLTDSSRDDIGRINAPTGASDGVTEERSERWENGDFSATVNLSDPWPWPTPSGQTLLGTGLTAVAQVQGRYIVAEQGDSLCLIEQHIAHERVLYERLQEQWAVVPLDQPVVLEGLTDHQQEQLQRIGIAVEPFGPQRWAIRHAPAPLKDRPDLADALRELSLGHSLDAALVAVACRTALRNGTPLSLPEMQTLLNDWQRTRHPRTCPHGRPICLTLQEASLARFFRRHWVIGKSHGLD